MPQYVQTANLILSFLTVITQILSVVILLLLTFGKNRVRHNVLQRLSQTHFLLAAFLVALIATGGSLFYSEIAGYEPCKLCWYQRILMYPQVVLFGLALAGRLRDVMIAAGALSGIGAIIAGYHYLLQIGVVTGSNCDALGYSVACSQRFVMNFGYITIPLMAFSAFMLIFLLTIAGSGTHSLHEIEPDPSRAQDRTA